jgi:hypothetical protein
VVVTWIEAKGGPRVIKPKLSTCIGFLKACARELKGPVDLFKGFQQEPKSHFISKFGTIQRPGGHTEEPDFV